MWAFRVVNIRCCGNEPSFGGKGQKHSKTS